MLRYLSDKELDISELNPTFSVRATALLAHQWEHFPMAKTNHEGLAGVQEKQIDIDGLSVKVQFNPARIVSSAAKVDEKSIRERKCFLCEANLPVEQRALSFDSQYLVLCNPFMIFPKHLTIPHKEHTDQRISGRIGDMLRLSAELSDFVVFYNGPKCGASAPDHFHFQAGNKGFLPLETELHSVLTRSVSLIKKDELEVYRAKPFGSNAILILSENILKIETVFSLIYNCLSELNTDEPEPMLNLLAWEVDKRICLAVFPRKVHRPRQFFAEGDANILLSPASVDLAGVFITPLQKDFDKISAEDLTDILSQIMVSDTIMDDLCEYIAK